MEGPRSKKWATILLREIFDDDDEDDEELVSSSRKWTFKEIVGRFTEAFLHVDPRTHAMTKLMALNQRGKTASEYWVEFQTLSAGTGLQGEPLVVYYRKGLGEVLRKKTDLQAALQGATFGLKRYAQLSIVLDGQYQQSKAEEEFFGARNTGKKDKPSYC